MRALGRHAETLNETGCRQARQVELQRAVEAARRLAECRAANFVWSLHSRGPLLYEGQVRLQRDKLVGDSLDARVGLCGVEDGVPCIKWPLIQDWSHSGHKYWLYDC